MMPRRPPLVVSRVLVSWSDEAFRVVAVDDFRQEKSPKVKFPLLPEDDGRRPDDFPSLIHAEMTGPFGSIGRGMLPLIERQVGPQQRRRTQVIQFIPSL